MSSFVVLLVRALNEDDIETILSLNSLLGEEGEREQIKKNITLPTGRGRYYGLKEGEEDLAYILLMPAKINTRYLEIVQLVAKRKISLRNIEQLILIGEHSFKEEYYNRMGSNPRGILFQTRETANAEMDDLQKLGFRRLTASDTKELWVKTYGQGNIYKS